MNRFVLLIFLSIGFFACKNESTTSDTVTEQGATASEGETAPTSGEANGFKPAVSSLGSIVEMTGALSSVLNTSSTIEVLASGFDWTEGPLWVPALNALLFSDIPPNRVYKWKAGEGISIYLEPSGYTGSKKRKGEPGSNGLLLNNDGQLVLCQHGDRRIAVMDAPLDNPTATYKTLVDKYQNKRLNSPNDAVFNSDGTLYFTDPYYGLEGGKTDPAKELKFQGVYKFKFGQLELLKNNLFNPNGIALSPDEKTLYVANSNESQARWYAYELDEEGSLAKGKIFYDATEKAKEKGVKGLPDGMVVSQDGTIFATGPGGVYIFNSNATLLGMIALDEAASNCTLGGPNNNWLYITNDMHLLRVQLK